MEIRLFGIGIILVFSACFKSNQAITTDYLNQICNSHVSVTRSRRLESSTRLFYEPLLNCTYTVTVPTGNQVLLLPRLFDLESKVNGACVDYVNVYDGADTTSTLLNADPLCAEDMEGNFTATGNELTIHFQTDGTGARHGFDFIFVAITTGTCASSQFACNTSICIHSSLRCTVFDECGDESDEAGCTYDTPTGVKIHDQAALIIGLLVGLFVLFVVCCLVGYYCYRNHVRWRMFKKRPFTIPEVTHEETSYATTYPITKTYYKNRVQSMYLDPSAPITDMGRREPVKNASGSLTSSD